MNPIAIVQHIATDGPSYFATWCARVGLPVRVFRMDQGDTLPQDVAQLSGLCLLGGPMGANDALPYYGVLYSLIAQAIERGVPVIGHCLGGQMLARALGATVQAAPCVEIGWSLLHAQDPTLAQEWFGPGPQYPLFQWHGECFSLPPQAQPVLGGKWCPQQAFVARGRHLGMQFHIEVDAPKVRQWLELGAQEIAQCAASPAVQDAHHILPALESDLARSQALADHAYTRWARSICS